MTTHRRALLLRAGAAAVLVTSALVTGLASPAAAAVTISVQTGSFDMNPGDTKNVVVQFSGDKTDDVAVTFTAPSANGNITIKSVPPDADCDSPGGNSVTCTNVDVPQNGTKNLTFQVQAKTPSTLQPGQSLNNQQGSISGGGANGSYSINLKGPAQTAVATPTVQEVSGTVNDSTTGKAIKGASVAMEDGAGKSRSVNTNDSGVFRFLGSEANPIVPGGISISVTMNGYDAGNKDVTGVAGKSNTGLRISLVPIGSTASPVAPPTNEESTPAGADSQSAAPGAGNTTKASNDSGSGMSSYILIALGALLVIFGIVAIVLLLRRRGDDDDEELEEEPAPRRGGGGQRPGYRQPQADPTMVGAMGGATTINRGAANDATAIVRPGRANDYDVPPDPYGAPLPRAGSGYGAAGAGAGYGAANGGGYNDQAGFAQGAPPAGPGYGPASRPAVDPYGPEYGAGGGNGYNDQAGGYGGPAGGPQGGAYADSTQRWEPSAGNGYAGAQSGGGGGGGYNGGGANGYGAEPGQNGYGGGYNGGGGANGYGADQAGYGPGGGADAGGYGPPAGQSGYGPGGGGAGDGYPSAGGGYSPSAGNGYNGQADYDGPYAGRGGYEQRGGYEPAAGQRGGYEPAAGYERDGYERVPEPPRAGNGYEGGNENYEQRGGYGEPQAGPRGQAGNNRRSLDWLDD